MKQKLNKSKKPKAWVWPVIVLILAITLSLSFSLLSELILDGSALIVAIIVIFVFVALAIITDMLGLAVASANIEHFTAMAARKVKGSKQAIALIKNADRVSSIFNDVVGDVCGILSGAAGASIVTKIVVDNSASFMSILIPSLIAAIIAGITIFGKAILKKCAIKYANPITLQFSKFLNFFTRKG